MAACRVEKKAVVMAEPLVVEKAGTKADEKAVEKAAR